MLLFWLRGKRSVISVFKEIFFNPIRGIEEHHGASTLPFGTNWNFTVVRDVLTYKRKNQLRSFTIVNY